MAFIKGRYILDGVIIIHETIHEIRKRKLKGVMFKIDFEKAYDSVNWNFLKEVLRRKGNQLDHERSERGRVAINDGKLVHISKHTGV